MVAGDVSRPLRLTEEQAYVLPPLTLAYMGDAVWELFVRSTLVMRGERQPKRLHGQAVAFVKAQSQADRLHRLQEELTERERQVVRRGRNAKSGSVPKNAKVADYRASTGLEALLGYLYAAGQEERLLTIMNWLVTEGSQQDGDEKSARP